MYENAFKKLELEEVASLLDTYNPLFDGLAFDPLETTVMAQKISFYPGYTYYDVADYSCMPPIHRYVIDGPKSKTVLDWTNDPIYQLNQTIHFVLDEETVSDYIRFFFSHVRGKKGQFMLAESIDDINWRDDPPPAARKTIGEMLKPLNDVQAISDSGFATTISVMFKDSLFQCDLVISQNGLIEMSNEKLLVEDMPVMDDIIEH